MKRRLLAAAAALCALLALPAAGHGAAARFIVGVSDQQSKTFASPAFTALGMKTARFITPYDVMSLKGSSVDRVALNYWVEGARRDHQDILISFEHSHTRGRERRTPSAAAFRKQMVAFHRTFPFIKSISPWNEANRCQARSGKTWVGQPICHNPKAAATYYNVARSVFKGARIVGLDVLDQNKVGPTVSYIRRFLHYAKHRPTIWGFHNYSDTNRFSSSRTRAMLKATRRGDVWLTETGGIVHFGRSFPTSTKRAAKALGCMFTIARSNRRIKRLYIYQFNGARPKDRFDAGLVNVNGVKRPGWTVVKKRKAARCHR